MKWPAKWALALGFGVLFLYFVAKNGEQPPTSPPAAPEPTQAAAAPNPNAAPQLSANPRDAVERAFDAFCGLNLRYIKAMFDATRTTCRITGYRHGLIILFTAEQPVFRVPAARKAWAISVVLTAGKTIRDLGGNLIGVDYVGLTDSEHAETGRVARFPASFAEHLQAAVHDGKVDAITAVGNLDRRLARSFDLAK